MGPSRWKKIKACLWNSNVADTKIHSKAILDGNQELGVLEYSKEMGVWFALPAPLWYKQHCLAFNKSIKQTKQAK